MANTAPTTAKFSSASVLSLGLDGLMRGLGIKAHIGNSFIPGMPGSNTNPRTASPSETIDESPLDRVYVDNVGREDTSTYRDAVRVVKDSERLAATDQVEAIRRLDTGVIKLATYVQGEFTKIRTSLKDHASSINTLSDQNLQLQRRQRALDDQIKFLSNQGRGNEKTTPDRIETSKPVAKSGFSWSDLLGAAAVTGAGAAALRVLKGGFKAGLYGILYEVLGWLKQKKGQEELRPELKREGWSDAEIDFFFTMSDEDKVAYFDKRTNNRFTPSSSSTGGRTPWRIPDDPSISAQSMDRRTFDQWYQRSQTGVAAGFGTGSRYASRLGNSFTSAASQLGADRFGDNRTFRRSLATKDPNQPKALENGGWPIPDGHGGYRPPNATGGGGGGGGARGGSGGQSYVEPPTPWSHSMRQGNNGGGTTLAEQRAPYAAQFANDPALLERLKVLSIAEVGSSDQNAQAALMESAMNRGKSHNVKDISSMLGANYYQPFQDGGYNRALAQYRSDPALRARTDAAFQDAIGGSNHSNYATHNSSAGVAESARRTQTATNVLAKEQFSRKDNPNYAGLHGARTVQEEGDWFRRTQAAMARSRDPQADLKGVTKIVPGHEYPSGKGVGAMNDLLRGGGGATGGALRGHTTEGVDPKLRHVVSEGVRQFEQEHPDLGVKVISGLRTGSTDKGNHSGRGAEGGVQGGAAIDIQIYNKKTGQVYPNIGRGTPPSVIALHQEINKNIYASGQHFYPNSGLRFGSFFSTGNEYDFMHADLTKNQSNRGQYGGAVHGDMLRGFTPGAQRELGLTAEQNKAMHFGNPQAVKDLVEKMYPKDVTPPGGNTATSTKTPPPGGDTATGIKPPTNDATSIKPPTPDETVPAPAAKSVKDQSRFQSQTSERHAFSYTNNPSNITKFGHATIGDSIRPKEEAPAYVKNVMDKSGNEGRGAPAVSADGKIYLDREGIKKGGTSYESTVHHELGHHGAKNAYLLGGKEMLKSMDLFPEVMRHGADFEELRNRLADERDAKNRAPNPNEPGTHIGDWVHPQTIQMADKLAAKDGITRDQMIARAKAYEDHLNEKLANHPDFIKAPYGYDKRGKPNPRPQPATLIEDKPTATTGSKGERGDTTLRAGYDKIKYTVGGGPDATNVTKPIPTDDNPKIEKTSEAPIDDGPKGKGDSSGDESNEEKPASGGGGASPGKDNDDNGGYGRVNTAGAGGSTDFGSSPGSDGYGNEKESPDNNGGICAI